MVPHAAEHVSLDVGPVEAVLGRRRAAVEAVLVRRAGIPAPAAKELLTATMWAAVEILHRQLVRSGPASPPIDLAAEVAELHRNGWGPWLDEVAAAELAPLRAVAPTTTGEQCGAAASVPSPGKGTGSGVRAGLVGSAGWRSLVGVVLLAGTTVVQGGECCLGRGVTDRRVGVDRNVVAAARTIVRLGGTPTYSVMTERIIASLRRKLWSGMSWDDPEHDEADGGFRVDPAGEYSAGSASLETPDLVSVPTQKYVTVEVTDDFREELAVLRRVARLIAVTCGAGELSYDETPLEGFWRSDNDTRFDPSQLGAWRWRAAIAVRGDPSELIVRSLIASQASSRVGVTLITVSEGVVVQALHHGTYDSISTTIDTITRELERRHLEPTGDHHEIYLTDPASTQPDQSRTLIRQPVRNPQRRRPPSVFDEPEHPDTR